MLTRSIRRGQTSAGVAPGPWHTAGVMKPAVVLFVSSAVMGVAADLHAAVPPLHLPIEYRPRIERYDSDSGLPQNSINALLIDRAGYLWLGTFGGLVRFDGREFEIVPSRPDDGPPSDRIKALYEDAEGRLWIGTEDGGLGIRTTTGHYQVVPGLCPTYCRIDRLLTAADEVLAETPNGVVRIARDLSWRPWTHVADAVLRHLVEADEGVWYGIDQTHLWRGPAGRMERVGTRMSGPIEGMYWIRGALYLATQEDLYRWTGVDWVPAFLRTRLPGVRSMYVRGDGRLWIGTEAAGLWTHEPGAERPLRVDLDAELRSPRLLEDGDGGLWIGTDGQGLWHWQESRVGSLGGRGKGLDRSIVAAVPAKDGALWIAALCEGLYRYREPHLERPKLRGESPDRCAWTLAAPADGSVLVGDQVGRVVRITTEDRGELLWQAPAGLEVLALHMHDADGLWIGTSAGLFRLRGGRAHLLSGSESLRVKGIHPGRDGTLWITSDQGLWRVSGDALVSALEGQRLASRFLRGWHEDAHGALWLGTYGGGLYRYSAGALRHYSRTEGLHEDVVSCILEDGRGRLWMSGNRGLSALLRSDLERQPGGSLAPVLYNRSSGLPASETNGIGFPACARDGTGRLWFPLISGLAVVDPERVPNRRSLAGPKVELRYISVNGRPVRPPIVIRSSQDHLSIRLTAPILGGAHRLKFRYRIGETAWIELGPARELSLSALPRGRYRLAFAARIDDGPWSAAESLTVEHPTPWYEARGFWLLLAFLSLLAIGGLVRWRTRQLTRLNQRLDRMVAERTADLADMTRQAQALAAARSSFLARMSHEMRSPLAVISGYTEQALNRGTDAAGMRRALEITREHARHLLEVVNDVLDAAQIDAGELRIKAEAVDPVALVQDVVTMLAPSAEGKGLELSTEFAWPLPETVIADPLRLRQILLNLIGNAIKFCDRGRIRVRVRVDRADEDAWLRCTVSDDGPGISPELQERLFLAFSQGDESRKRSKGGTGLGLYISRELARRMGGELELVHSDTRGSQFELSLPVARAIPWRNEPKSAPREDGPAAAAAPPLRVLVVDDEPLLLELMGGYLGMLGVSYRLAQGGREALDLVAAESFDVILLDMHMPEMHGHEVARWLRRRGFGGRIVALTADVVADSVAAHRAAGCDDVIAKPVRLAILRALLERSTSEAPVTVSTGS